MRKLLAAAVFAALAAGPTFAFAQGTSPASDTNSLSTDRADKAGDTVGDRRPFDEMDTDDDGYIAKNEVQQDNEMIARFGRYDDDGDDRLSPAEYEGYRAGGVPPANDAAVAEEELDEYEHELDDD